MTPLAQLSDDEFLQIKQIVYKAAGLAISQRGRTILSSRVRKRLKSLDLDSFREYLDHLSSDSEGTELTALLDAVCSKETSFYRTPSHFEWFAGEFLAQLPRRERGAKPDAATKNLKIWSAACSSGEEAYSLAIILLYHEARLSHFNVKLYASDLSTSVIEYAKEGVYSPKDISKLDVAVQRYFEPCESVLRVKDRVKRRVDFSVHNLMQPAPYRNVDCLFLRNVLIYFDKASKETVLSNVTNAIRPGGYLVVGPSEGVFDIPVGLERVKPFLFRRC
jgi:chemotaxis protein methyltransferase CheR